MLFAPSSGGGIPLHRFCELSTGRILQGPLFPVKKNGKITKMSDEVPLSVAVESGSPPIFKPAELERARQRHLPALLPADTDKARLAGITFRDTLTTYLGQICTFPDEKVFPETGVQLALGGQSCSERSLAGKLAVINTALGNEEDSRVKFFQISGNRFLWEGEVTYGQVITLLAKFTAPFPIETGGNQSSFLITNFPRQLAAARKILFETLTPPFHQTGNPLC